MMTHEVSVIYTINDDGIWLQCECGWEKNFGFSPDLQLLCDQAEKHQREEAR